MSLSAEKIITKLKSDAAVHVYDSVDSTNNEAKRRASADRGIHIYAAASQTAGRGRRGHSFYSPADTGLYMTVALPLSGDPASVQRITCAAAVAVCEALEAMSDCEPRIKWVNDIYVNGRKAVGILAELIGSAGNKPASVIIGVGANLSTESFPEDIALTAGNIGGLNDEDPETLCAAIADRLIYYYNNLDDNSVIEKYAERNLCVGRRITFIRGGKEITAEAVGIDSDGGLIVDSGGERLTLNSGEISVRI